MPPWRVGGGGEAPGSSLHISPVLRSLAHLHHHSLKSFASYDHFTLSKFLGVLGAFDDLTRLDLRPDDFLAKTFLGFTICKSRIYNSGDETDL